MLQNVRAPFFVVSDILFYVLYGFLWLIQMASGNPADVVARSIIDSVA